MRDFGLPLAMLVAVIWSGAKRYWVFGWAYEDALKRAEQAERRAEQWRTAALESQDSTQELVTAIRDSIREQLRDGATRATR